MYHLSNPNEVIWGLKSNSITQNRVIDDLLNADVKCDHMKNYLQACYAIISENIPSFTSPFLKGVTKIEEECEIDLFDLIYSIIEDTKNFFDNLLYQEKAVQSFPQYLPLIYTYSNQNYNDITCRAILELINIEKNRDKLPLKRYITLIKTLTYKHFNNGIRCRIKWDESESSKFIKNLLIYSPAVREQILKEHVDQYTLFRQVRDEYDSVMDAIKSLHELEVDEDGWKPLPIMDLEAFVAEEAKINLLRKMNELKAKSDI